MFRGEEGRGEAAEAGAANRAMRSGEGVEFDVSPRWLVCAVDFVRFFGVRVRMGLRGGG